jgi:hypothetical protein
MARSQRLMGGWRAAPYYIHASELGRILTSILRRALKVHKHEIILNFFLT